jgi:hypothetical protein
MTTFITRDELRSTLDSVTVVDPLLVVSVHERGTLRQTWLREEPA